MMLVWIHTNLYVPKPIAFMLMFILGVLSILEKEKRYILVGALLFYIVIVLNYYLTYKELSFSMELVYMLIIFYIGTLIGKVKKNGKITNKGEY